jgi:hypothetical protein
LRTNSTFSSDIAYSLSQAASEIVHLDAVRSQQSRDALRVVRSDDRLDPLSGVNEQRDPFVTAPKSRLNQRRGSVVPHNRHLRSAFNSNSQASRISAYGTFFEPSSGPYLRITSASDEHAIKPSSYSKSLVAPAIRYSS